MARRVPLWLTLVPLAAGIAGYYALWTTYAGLFRDQLAAQLDGRAVAVSGFPYRVSATIAAPHLGLDAGGLHGEISAAQVVADRTPWRPELTVLRLSEPRLTVGQFVVGAPAALASVHVEHGRLTRLSVVYDHPRGEIGSLGVRFTADRLETHLRTLPATPGAELVASGSGVRLDGGDPLTLGGDGRGDGAGSVAVGTVHIEDASGTVATRSVGGVETVCPATVDAAIRGTPAAQEFRLRQPVVLGAGPSAALPASARRLQLPPCPVIRGPVIRGPIMRGPLLHR